MRYSSDLGSPCRLVDRQASFPLPILSGDLSLKRGESYRGFVLPQNFYGTADRLCSRYGLWQNENGLGLPGRPKLLLSAAGRDGLSAEPIFAGDLVSDGSIAPPATVLSALGRYNRIMALWRVTLVLQTAPLSPPSDAPPENPYASALADLGAGLRDLAKSLTDYDALVRSIPLVCLGSAPGAPIALSPDSVRLFAQMSSKISEISQSMSQRADALTRSRLD